MRRPWVGIFVLAVAVVGGAPTFAVTPQSQPPAAEITVDELVARALAENPDVLAAQADVDAAKGRLLQAGLRPNPMLELGGQKALGPDNNVMVGLSAPARPQSAEGRARGGGRSGSWR